MLTIHSFGHCYRVLELKGKFLPQHTINGNQWHNFHENGSHVEFASLFIAIQYINSARQEVRSWEVKN